MGESGSHTPSSFPSRINYLGNLLADDFIHLRVQSNLRHWKRYVLPEIEVMTTRSPDKYCWAQHLSVGLNRNGLNSFLRLLKAFVIVPDFDACQECF
jgi:hypothetical protein